MEAPYRETGEALSAGGAKENHARVVAPGDAGERILFFDGVCGLCNRFVDFLVARDRARAFLLAPLQGETAAARVPGDAAGPGVDPRGLVLLEEGKIWRKSDAALRAASRLGGFWRFASVLLWVPRVLRDAVYDRVARNRDRLFGKLESCRVPSPAERECFLP